MTRSFTPNGFDHERKHRAAQCEAKWDAATAGVAGLGVAAAAVFPSAAPGLLLLAALGPVMRYPFTRAKLDPAQQDYFKAARVRRPLADPSIVAPTEGFVEFAPPLVAFSLDRAAAHLDAMIDAGERALGAYQHQSHAGMEARLAEARMHARHALSSLYLALRTSVRLTRADELQPDQIRPLMQRALATGRDRTIQELIGDSSASSSSDLAELIGSCGPLGIQALTLRPFAAGVEALPDTGALGEALRDSVDFVSSVIDTFPQSVEEFISPEQGTGVSALVGELTAALAGDAPDLVVLRGFLGPTTEQGGESWRLLYLDPALRTWVLVKEEEIVAHHKIKDETIPTGTLDFIWVRSGTAVMTGSGPQSEAGRFLVGKSTRVQDIEPSWRPDAS